MTGLKKKYRREIRGRATIWQGVEGGPHSFYTWGWVETPAQVSRTSDNNLLRQKQTGNTKSLQIHRHPPILFLDHRGAYKCNKSAKYPKYTYIIWVYLLPAAICRCLCILHQASIFRFFNSFSLLPERLICHRVGGLRKNKLISQRGFSYTLQAPVSLVCLLRLHLLFPVSKCARLLYLHTWNLAASLLVPMSGWR